VRIGVALVHTHRSAASDAERVERLSALASLLVPEPRADELRRFIAAPDPTPALDRADPAYTRAVLAAELGEAAGRANSTPDEVRYNVQQTLQYLAAWLSGSGCVALPATVRGTRVRVMDDLATTERSRWQLFLELYHGRFDLDAFLAIVDDQMRRIRSDTGDDLHVKWSPDTAKWYPVARRLLVRLATDREPVEFATELLMAFTVDAVRGAADPWAAAAAIDARKFRSSPYADAHERYLAAQLGAATDAYVQPSAAVLAGAARARPACRPAPRRRSTSRRCWRSFPARTASASPRCGRPAGTATPRCRWRAAAAPTASASRRAAPGASRRSTRFCSTRRSASRSARRLRSSSSRRAACRSRRASTTCCATPARRSASSRRRAATRRGPTPCSCSTSSATPARSASTTCTAPRSAPRPCRRRWRCCAAK
jgi:hypothetical protein